MFVFVKKSPNTFLQPEEGNVTKSEDGSDEWREWGTILVGIISLETVSRDFRDYSFAEMKTAAFNLNFREVCWEGIPYSKLEV